MASTVNEPHVNTDVTRNKKNKRLDLAKTYFDQKILIPRDEDNDDVSIMDHFSILTTHYNIYFIH